MTAPDVAHAVGDARKRLLEQAETAPPDIPANIALGDE
jgi:hypothetical protein